MCVRAEEREAESEGWQLLANVHLATVGCINFQRSLLLNPVYFAKGLSRQLFNSRRRQPPATSHQPPVVMSALFCGGRLMGLIYPNTIQHLHHLHLHSAHLCRPPFAVYPTRPQLRPIEGHLMRGQVSVGLGEFVAPSDNNLK